MAAGSGTAKAIGYTLKRSEAASPLTCYSKEPLADAQREIATDWIVADGFEPKSLR